MHSNNSAILYIHENKYKKEPQNDDQKKNAFEINVC